jgi:DNA excision repair protein ERCC-4
LKKLYLYPRFRHEIIQSLETRLQPVVIELKQSLTKNMKHIQSSIFFAMNTCLKEIKKNINNNFNIDATFLTLENAISSNFDFFLKTQMENDWHKVTFKLKQIVADITVLRKLLDFLIRYDAFSFYYLLLKFKIASSEQVSPSLWFFFLFINFYFI